MRQQRTVQVRRSPADVFAYVTDNENAPRWAEGIVAIRTIKETPEQVGSRFEVDIQEGPKVNTYTGVSLVHDPPRRKRDRMGRDGFFMEMQLDFEPTDDGTRLTQSVEYEPKGLIWMMNRRSLSKQTGKLKELLEQG